MCDVGSRPCSCVCLLGVAGVTEYIEYIEADGGAALDADDFGIGLIECGDVLRVGKISVTGASESERLCTCWGFLRVLC